MDAQQGAPPVGQQIVHVRGDSQSELEALFSAVMNPNKSSRTPSSLPMRMRKLPDSFFRQPDARGGGGGGGGHSRQASSDGGVCGSLTPHHVRAHSSPASLPVNSLSAQPADVAATPLVPEDTPLPHGWEMAKTPSGQRYFLNHLDKTTTWHDPRLSLQSSVSQLAVVAPLHVHSLSSPTAATQSVATETVQKRLPGFLGAALQQRQEKERQRCKASAPQQTESGGRNATENHDRNLHGLDVRIRTANHEPALNGAHSRNESTDSGLSVSSLTRSSDHMLTSVDHMDTGESGDSSLSLQDPLPALPLSEGEELMPCIPEGLSSDLLMDMETVLSGSHMDKDSLLTWL